MIDISVVMSVYNETQEELSRAIESILAQSYKNFEFIIILDNPKNLNLKNLLEQYQQFDSRIKVYVNSENIGLALSLNKGIKESTGKYIARMDADDVSLPDRLKKEYEVLDSSNIDVVFCNYTIVDSNGTYISSVKRNYSNLKIREILPYNNIIAHPTVMFKKKLFLEVGEYRNFPCAQDYDLWLRMMEKGAKFYIVQDFLFKYTVREKAISQKNRIKQFETSRYIRHLFKERLKTGKDSFSIEDYNVFLKRNKVFDDRYINNFKKWNSYKKISNSKYDYVIRRIPLFLFCDFYRKYFTIVIFNLLKKKYYNFISYIKSGFNWG